MERKSERVKINENENYSVSVQLHMRNSNLQEEAHNFCAKVQLFIFANKSFPI